MVKLRAVLTGLVLATIVALAPPAAIAAAAPASAAAPVRAVASGIVAQQDDPGPEIDPEQTNKANQDKTKNKIVVGVMAAVLAAIVVWGRTARRKKRKAAG